MSAKPEGGSIDTFNTLLSVTDISRQPVPEQWLVQDLLPLVACLAIISRQMKQPC
ncbi:hypothetical protein [Chitinophaga pinensis]|uniref:hypothetical protein n=1 Tax=Chitinophaga pinensis TaxID=79329 RepID=UPI001645ABB4|nr:hypothetical protein [Chitinophaga pinensis]